MVVTVKGKQNCRPHIPASRSLLICKVCGAKMYIPRQLKQQRERAHIKDIWCHVCRAVTKHTEIRACDFVPVIGADGVTKWISS